MNAIVAKPASMGDVFADLRGVLPRSISWSVLDRQCAVPAAVPVAPVASIAAPPPVPDKHGAGNMDEAPYVTDESLLCSREAGRRWKAALEARYPHGARVKLIMRDLHAAEPTVLGWLQGKLPQNRHLLRASVLWGPDFVAEFFHQKTPRQLALEALVELQESRRQLDKAISRAEAALRR